MLMQKESARKRRKIRAQPVCKKQMEPPAALPPMHGVCCVCDGCGQCSSSQCLWSGNQSNQAPEAVQPRELGRRSIRDRPRAPRCENEWGDEQTMCVSMTLRKARKAVMRTHRLREISHTSTPARFGRLESCGNGREICTRIRQHSRVHPACLCALPPRRHIHHVRTRQHLRITHYGQSVSGAAHGASMRSRAPERGLG